MIITVTEESGILSYNAMMRTYQVDIDKVIEPLGMSMSDIRKLRNMYQEVGGTFPINEEN